MLATEPQRTEGSFADAHESRAEGGLPRSPSGLVDKGGNVRLDWGGANLSAKPSARSYLARRNDVLAVPFDRRAALNLPVAAFKVLHDGSGPAC
jgi:hypothetical protein